VGTKGATRPCCAVGNNGRTRTQSLLAHGLLPLLVERLTDASLVVRVGAAGALRYG
jgi:hypothetical protein